MPTYFEFFCGGGMVRAGLGDVWRCLFANDFDHKKCLSYSKNWGEAELLRKDIRIVRANDIPGRADLAWASFPCQDLSLAGGGAGLKGDRSGTFWPFWDLMKELVSEGRAPAIVALENVCGALTSHGGRDFTAICSAYRMAGYRVGAIVVDAALFLPQSRPRLFVIGVRKELRLPELVETTAPIDIWHNSSLRRAYSKLSKVDQKNWIWWSLPKPCKRRKSLKEAIQNTSDISWHTAAQTKEIIQMMDKTNRQKLRMAQECEKELLGTMYRRTRPNPYGGTIQRVEVRFDGIAGCLRTPAGGSSRQLVIRVAGKQIQTRLLSAREAANLMGLPKKYVLPANYNEAYHLAGDGVAVPVIEFLSSHLFLLIQKQNEEQSKLAA